MYNPLHGVIRQLDIYTPVVGQRVAPEGSIVAVRPTPQDFSCLRFVCELAPGVSPEYVAAMAVQAETRAVKVAVNSDPSGVTAVDFTGANIERQVADLLHDMSRNLERVFSDLMLLPMVVYRAAAPSEVSSVRHLQIYAEKVARWIAYQL